MCHVQLGAHDLRVVSDPRVETYIFPVVRSWAKGEEVRHAWTREKRSNQPSYRSASNSTRVLKLELMAVAEETVRANSTPRGVAQLLLLGRGRSGLRLAHACAPPLYLLPQPLCALRVW